MAVIPFTKFFTKVPAGSRLETWVELSAGHVQSDVWVVDSDPATPDQNWNNSTVLRSPANPQAKGVAPIVGPAGAVLLANLVAIENGTKGKMELRIVDATGKQIRSETWAFDNPGLQQADVVNGLLLVQLT